MVRSSLTNPPVATLEFAPLELPQWTAYPDEEDVELPKQMQESVHPLLGFDNMLDDEVIPRFGKCRQATVKSIEELRAQFVPHEFAGLDASARQNVSGI